MNEYCEMEYGCLTPITLVVLNEKFVKIKKLVFLKRKCQWQKKVKSSTCTSKVSIYHSYQSYPRID